MNFNKKQFKGRLPIRLLGVGGEHSIPNMGESLQPYFENVTSLVIPESGHFVPEEQPAVLGGNQPDGRAIQSSLGSGGNLIK
jgi:pimeloyl-ACP methyl ester carboxylesterase